jgi:hypothetical protein
VIATRLDASNFSDGNINFDALSSDFFLCSIMSLPIMEWEIFGLIFLPFSYFVTNIMLSKYLLFIFVATFYIMRPMVRLWIVVIYYLLCPPMYYVWRFESQIIRL